jgi:hypothetical protein
MRVSQIFLYAAASGAALAQTTLPACFGRWAIPEATAMPGPPRLTHFQRAASLMRSSPFERYLH